MAIAQSEEIWGLGLAVSESDGSTNWVSWILLNSTVEENRIPNVRNVPNVNWAAGCELGDHDRCSCFPRRQLFSASSSSGMYSPPGRGGGAGSHGGLHVICTALYLGCGKIPSRWALQQVFPQNILQLLNSPHTNGEWDRFSNISKFPTRQVLRGQDRDKINAVTSNIASAISREVPSKPENG